MHCAFGFSLIKATKSTLFLSIFVFFFVFFFSVSKQNNSYQAFGKLKRKCAWLFNMVFYHIKTFDLKTILGH